MIHEPYQELIALRLYEEIDEEQLTRLERHLATCADCARYASEIESGLGSIARGQSSSADLPADWTQRLREATQDHGVQWRRMPWWAAAASFAAGVLATAVIAQGPSAPAPTPEREPLSTWEQFHRAEPPPLASTAGQLARLSEYLRR